MLAVAFLALLVTAQPWASAALDHDRPMRATRRGEVSGAAGGGFFVWGQHRRSNPDQFDIFVKTPSGKLRVNRGESQGSMGGIDGHQLVFQKYEGHGPRQGYSDIWSFNLKTHATHKIRSVSTWAWEYTPTISGDWLLFSRWNPNKGFLKVVLHNLRTNEERTLDRVKAHAYVQTGQVNGNWVTYLTRAYGHPRLQLRLVRYNIRTRQKRAIVDRYSWAPSVSDTGDVYYLTTGARCGTRPVFKRFRPTPTPGDKEIKVIRKYREGIDMSRSFAYRDGKGRLAIIHEKAHCNNLLTGSDIYRLR
jgi:hypothetical protein